MNLDATFARNKVVELVKREFAGVPVPEPQVLAQLQAYAVPTTLRMVQSVMRAPTPWDLERAEPDWLWAGTPETFAVVVPAVALRALEGPPLSAWDFAFDLITHLNPETSQSQFFQDRFARMTFPQVRVLADVVRTLGMIYEGMVEPAEFALRAYWGHYQTFVFTGSRQWRERAD